MLYTNLKHGSCLLLAAAFIASPLARAADQPITERPTSRSQIFELINAGLPEDSPLRGDMSELVMKMMAVNLEPPLSRTFNPKLAIQRLLGRGARLAPECQQVFTKAGDPDRLPCFASVGTADGTGAYRQLGFSKHMALGNVSFFDRPADREISIAELVPVRMGDDEAYAKAQSWLAENFGLGSGEIPMAPANARNPYPVRTIAMAAMDGETGGMQSVEVEKQVIIHRGLFTGLGGNFDWVPAPGVALVTMDDLGVKQAAIKQWQELAPNPDIDPRNAKTLDELSNEIADDLAGLMKGPIDRIRTVLTFGVVAPTDDQDLRGLLLPAVQVFVSSVPADLDEGQQQELAQTQVSTAGVVREFSLVNFPAETKGDE